MKKSKEYRPVGQVIFIKRGQRKQKRNDWSAKVYKKSQYDDFFDSAEWRKIRRACFYRDVYCCLRCGKRFKISELTAHHVIPRDDGGPDDLSNFVSLCSPCHDFVEIKGFRTQAEIIGSYESQKTEQESAEEQNPEPEADDGRPEWHKWVYGGKRRTYDKD